VNEKAEIVLSSNVSKTINWMTENVNTEVAALGVCELKEGKMFVEKLVFPNQLVTSSSVKFGGIDWKPIIKEVGSENLHKLMFHWHKHPGGASPSQVDEDDTFGAFMCGTRPVFGFLITGMFGKKMDYDARIILEKPVKATIEAEITTEEDKEIEIECKKILEEKVKKEEIEFDSDVKNACIVPYLIEKNNKFVITFGSIYKKVIDSDLKTIEYKIRHKEILEKDGVCIYTLTAFKNKKLRKSLKTLIEDYDSEISQTELETFAKKDQNFLNYVN